MTKKKNVYSSANTSKGLDYIKKELCFINRKHELGFYKNALYWQFLFKLFRATSVTLSELTNTPFYIHRNKIELEITTHCNMRCYHCDRSCGQAYSNEHMSVEQIKYFIHESVKNNIKWPFIVLIGGEPTLHPNIYEICELMMDYKFRFSPNTKLTISTNGTSPETQDVLKRLPYIIHQENSSKTTSKQTHFDTFNVAPIDIEKYNNSKIDFSRGCNIPSLSGTALTRYGYYACGAAASIDRVLGLNIGIKNIKDRTERNFREQMNILCPYCGHFKSRKDDIYQLEDVSPTWQRIYEDYKRKKPQLSLYGVTEVHSRSRG